MKSNQAATGLLYVALVFVLIGELLSSYLTVATGIPGLGARRRCGRGTTAPTA